MSFDARFQFPGHNSPAKRTNNTSLNRIFLEGHNRVDRQTMKSAVISMPIYICYWSRPCPTKALMDKHTMRNAWAGTLLHPRVNSIVSKPKLSWSRNYRSHLVPASRQNGSRCQYVTDVLVKVPAHQVWWKSLRITSLVFLFRLNWAWLEGLVRGCNSSSPLWILCRGWSVPEQGNHSRLGGPFYCWSLRHISHDP